MSYTKLLYHIILRTHRSTWAINETHERELYGYILGICNKMNVKLFRIGGMPDHIHLLVSIPSNLSLAKFVQVVKTFSSRWLKANPNFPLFDGWTKEYGGFSYAYRDKDIISNYIIRQKEHHKQKSFAEEYRTILIENGIEIDERYFLRDG